MLTIEEIEKIPFVFIVGRGRSGTTLLQTILDAHPNVMLPLESRFIIHLKTNYFKIKNWTPRLIDALVKDLYKEKKFDRLWRVEEAVLHKKLNSLPLNRISFSIICKILYLSYPSLFKKQQIQIIGDKNPLYSIYIEELKEVFPDAKFVHLIRDYRDNIVSYKQVFELEKSIALMAIGWKIYNRSIDASKAKRPDLFYTLRYEDLVTFPEKYLKEICQFLNLNFEPEMLNYRKKLNEDKNKLPKKELEHYHPNLQKAITTSQIDKWKTILTPRELALAEFIAGEYGLKYGYQPLNTEKSFNFYPSAWLAGLRYWMDVFVIKTFYKMPFIIRDKVTLLSKKLYEWLGIRSYYSAEDYKFQKDKPAK